MSLINTNVPTFNDFLAANFNTTVGGDRWRGWDAADIANVASQYDAVTAAAVNASSAPRGMNPYMPGQGGGPPLLPSGGFGGGITPSAGGGGVLGQIGRTLIDQATKEGLDWLSRGISRTFGSGGQGGSGGPVVPAGKGGTLGTGGMGGVGGIDLPMGGQQGAGGVIFKPGTGFVLRRSYGPAVINRDRKVRMNRMGYWELVPPRMNVLNPHALARAYRRMDGFQAFAKKALRHFGFHVTKHLAAKSGGKRRR